jgi:hypothetical protein
MKKGVTMEISSLQKARYAYRPKLPAALTGKIDEIQVKLGEPTESVADQSEVKALFPHTYGSPIAVFEKGSNPNLGKALRVGVILSGGQAPRRAQRHHRTVRRPEKGQSRLRAHRLSGRTQRPD